MIVEGQKRFNVEGTVIYGTDFVTRTAASVGKFVMRETSDSSSWTIGNDPDDETEVKGTDAFQ